MTLINRRTNRILAILLALVALIFISQIQPQSAEASHYRGALVTAEYHAPSGQHAAEVHITSTTLTRTQSGGGMYSVNVYFVDAGVPTLVNNCNGTSSQSQTVDTSNPLFEITEDIFTVSGCFSTPGVYIFESYSGCRIGGIENAQSCDIQFAAAINIDGVNDSQAPTFSSGYMYNIAYDANLSYSTNLGGLGQGNTAVTYALVTEENSVLDGYGASRVPCSDLNLATGAYRINSTFCTGAETIASAFGGGAKYYALKVRATDANGQYSTRDVLLYFNTTSNLPPAFTTVPAAGAFTVTPGSTATAQFCAQDPDVADSLNFTFSPTRSWITTGAVTPVSPATTPNTYCVDFTLAPPVGTSEAFNFEVSVYDNNNSFVRSASNLYSFQAGAVLPGAAPAAPTVFVPTAPQVTAIDPRLISLDTPQLVKISGERLAGVTKFTIRGITLTVKSNSAGEIIFEMPAQQVEGFADLYFETPQGNLTFSQAVFFSASMSNAQGPAVTSSVVSGFMPGSFAVTASVRAQMNKLVGQLRDYKSISCTGYAMGPTALAKDAALAKARAAGVCAYLKQALSGQVSTSTQAAQDLAVGSTVRRVEIRGSK